MITGQTNWDAGYQVWRTDDAGAPRADVPEDLCGCGDECECPPGLPCDCSEQASLPATGNRCDNCRVGIEDGPDLCGDCAKRPMDVLHAAKLAVQRRGDVYGPPWRHHECTALAWTALLRAEGLISDHVALSAETVQRMFVADKLMRDSNEPHRDARVDLIGYAVCMDQTRQHKGGYE